MTTAEETQNFAFQAEIHRLLDLLAHSLYQSKEIAIRELLSNASDALDKMRYLMLTDPNLKSDEPLSIRLEPDADAKKLVIEDNGIGMTRDELIANLGTIARSGSLEFLNRLTGDAKKDVSLIGQFGVGFYSAFMLAGTVEVVSRSHQGGEGWCWTSEGTGSFRLAPAEDAPARGTRIILHLKEEVLDLVRPSRLETIVQRYSGFIPHPVLIDDKQINETKPLWLEPRTQITDEQYTGFYQHLTHRTEEKPLWYIHLAVDSPIQFHAVLFCPPSNFERLGFGRVEHGLTLCAKRVLVDAQCRELLPEYLRFLHGIVDSSDLPLNVSRETLQDHSVFRKIRDVLVSRVLSRLDKLAAEDAEAFTTFQEQFGSAIKEGILNDFRNQESLAKLLRFASTAKESPVSLAEYAERMPASQKAIYYLGGPDLATTRNHPALEVFRKKELEVLLLAEPIDDFVLTALGKFGDKPLQSIDSAEVDLPESAEDSLAESLAPEPGFDRVLELFRKGLADRVWDVRASKRLTDSPACLVQAETGRTAQMDRVLRQANRDVGPGRRILEINPRSALIRRLCAISINPANDDFIRDCGRQLHANALAIEGEVLDPREMTQRVEGMMQQLADSATTILT